MWPDTIRFAMWDVRVADVSDCFNLTHLSEEPAHAKGEKALQNREFIVTHRLKVEGF